MPMYVNPPRYTGPQEVKYLFIDGGCLQAYLDGALKKFFEPADVKEHINYFKIGEDFTKILYYDCLPTQSDDESDTDYSARREQKIKFFNEIRMLDGWHVYEGTLRRRKRRGNEQKEVDVMLAVDMLTHSFRKNMHSATLLASDLDFKPLLDALIYEGMRVSLWYPNGETNQELIFAADIAREITMSQAYYWTSDAFQNENSLPGDFSENMSDFADYEEDAKFGLNQGGTLTLYKIISSGSFGVIYLNKDNRKIGFRYNELEKLKIFTSQLVKVDWDTPQVI
jgi:uncharacterized LabA/DUF88 family protein